MTDEAETLALPVGPRDHVVGTPDAPVTVVEYGDYECPFCAQTNKLVSDLLSNEPGTLRYVFRHFPLAIAHPRAQQAAEAAEAAGAQGKFWEMHHMLFNNPTALDLESLTRYAGQLGLDVERFEDELADQVHARRVRDNFMSGVRSGCNGTPTSFVNGVRHDGLWDARAFAAVIQAVGRAGQPFRT